MSSEQDSQREREALLDRLEIVYSEWEKNSPKTEPCYINAFKVINLTRALTFCTDPESRKQIEQELEALKPKADFIDISVSPAELLSLIQGLVFSIQSIEAKQYVKENIGNKQKWSKIAEIMLIKEPGVKLRQHDGYDELIEYWVHINQGLSRSKASEEVFKKFKFSSQEACDQWLKREITRIQRKKQEGVTDIFADLPKPSTSPRLK